MEHTGNHDAGNHQWPDYVNHPGNVDTAQTDGVETGVSYRHRDVPYINVVNGDRHEYRGRGTDRRGQIDTNCCTIDAPGRLPDASSIQLLAAEATRKGLPLNTGAPPVDKSVIIVSWAPGL